MTSWFLTRTSTKPSAVGAPTTHTGWLMGSRVRMPASADADARTRSTSGWT